MTRNTDDIERELQSCIRTQNWTQGRATRSSWVEELRDVFAVSKTLDAALIHRSTLSEDADMEELDATNLEVAKSIEAFQEVAEIAKLKQYELTELVVKDLLDIDYIRDDVANTYDVTPKSTTFKELVDEIRSNKWFLDDSLNGNRDGTIITSKDAYVYASCRSFDPDDLPYVTLDLVSGEISRW